MKKMLGTIFFMTVALFVVESSSSPRAHANALADDVIGELYAMKSVYGSEYAPIHWKQTFTSYDLQSEFNKALAAIQANPNLTQKQSREILKNFIYSMKDYHTSIYFISTESATLPFTVKGTDSKFYIMYIDRTKLSEEAFPFHIGDELVSFDGKPTAEAVAAVQAEIPANVPSTDKAMAEANLVSRQGLRGLNVPQGPVTIEVKTKGSTQVNEYQMVWDYTPEKVQERKDLQTLEPVNKITNTSKFHPQMSVDFMDVSSALKDAANPYMIGGRKTFTPALGIKVWESAETDFYHAYIFKTADKKLIGYIRIASYVAPDYLKAVAEFSRDIGMFESVTDSMVIDQVNNPGGSVFYLYSLASMLATQPLKTPKHRMALTQADVLESLQTLPILEAIKTDDDAKKAIPAASADGFPVSYESAKFALNYSKFMISEWNAGRKLTNPYWIGGVDHINPASVHYTKPILLLINALDFSGGDFFPAIMQDNKRVTVMGTRTAGAGGYVNDIDVPNNVGVMRFRCTESIAERVDSNPIENLGVKPDITYTMTDADFNSNYQEYVKAIQSALNNLK